MSARPRTTDAKTAKSASKEAGGKSRLDAVLSIGLANMSLGSDSASKTSLSRAGTAVVNAPVLSHMRAASGLQNHKATLSMKMKMPRSMPSVGVRGGSDLNWPMVPPGQEDVMVTQYENEINRLLGDLPNINGTRDQMYKLASYVLGIGQNGAMAGPGTIVRHAYVWLLFFFGTTLYSATVQGFTDTKPNGGFKKAWPGNAKKMTPNSITYLQSIVAQTDQTTRAVRDYWVGYYTWVNSYIVNFFVTESGIDIERNPELSVDPSFTQYLIDVPYPDLDALDAARLLSNRLTPDRSPEA
jgi:hypothetical protein